MTQETALEQILKSAFAWRSNGFGKLIYCDSKGKIIGRVTYLGISNEWVAESGSRHLGCYCSEDAAQQAVERAMKEPT